MMIKPNNDGRVGEDDGWDARRPNNDGISPDWDVKWPEGDEIKPSV